MYNVLEGVDVLIICIEWSIFRFFSFFKLKDLLKEFIIFDGRNLY